MPTLNLISLHGPFAVQLHHLLLRLSTPSFRLFGVAKFPFVEGECVLRELIYPFERHHQLLEIFERILFVLVYREDLFAHLVQQAD